MRCQDVMKRNVEWIDRGTTVHEAARKMRDLGIGFLPVCDHQGRVVGTLTDRDIAIRVAAEDRQASECRVGDVMSSGVVSCRPDDDLHEAEAKMAHEHKSRMVVTDTLGVIQGVISLSDIADREEPDRAIVTLREIAAREARPY